jgi:hypothetical protein
MQWLDFNCWTETLARTLDHIIILVQFRFNTIFVTSSHFEVLKSVLLPIGSLKHYSYYFNLSLDNTIYLSTMYI